MDINTARNLLAAVPATGFDVFERSTGDCQLVVPILHEDNDMLDIFLAESPLEGHVRICDYGLALMRLSYTFDISTDTRKDIFNSILINSGVGNDDGDLYIDVPVNRLYEGALRFAGCVQKVCNMRYWNREVVRSAFYEDLNNYISTDLKRFSPIQDYMPLPEHPLFDVDWALPDGRPPIYVIGVLGRNKAKRSAISLLEFQKASLSYFSLIVHDNIEDLSKRDIAYLTRNADKQYPTLNDFKSGAVNDIERIRGAA